MVLLGQRFLFLHVGRRLGQRNVLCLRLRWVFLPVFGQREQHQWPVDRNRHRFAYPGGFRNRHLQWFGKLCRFGPDQRVWGGSGYSWSYSGTFSESGTDQSSYDAATQLVLDAQGDWEPTTGSASGSGTNQWSYTWEGSYSYSGEGVSVSGNFTDSGTDAFSYGYTVTGNYSEGQWAETGSATVTLSGQNHFSYSETGTLALAGEGWALTGSLSSSGSQDAS